MENMNIHIETGDETMVRALELAAAVDRGEDFEAQAHFSFPNLETLLTILTPKRFTLLGTLRRMGPSSVRAVAGAVGRDYKAVHTDVAVLIEYGLIERQAKDRVAVLWDHVHADMRLAA